MPLTETVQACLDRAKVPMTPEDEVVGEAVLEDGETQDLTPRMYADSVCSSALLGLHEAASSLLEGPVTPSTVQAALMLTALGRQLHLWLAGEEGAVDLLLMVAMGLEPESSLEETGEVDTLVEALQDIHAPPTLQPQPNPFEALAERARALEAS